MELFQMISYESKLAPQLAVRAGEAEGKAEAKKEQREIDWRKESEIRANQLKMQMQQEEIYRRFLNDQRQKQIAIDRELRAHEWQTEKMEIASRLDFAEKEKARQKKHERLLNSLAEIDQLEQSGKYPAETIQDIRVQVALPYEKDSFTESDTILGKAGLWKRLLPKEKEQSVVDAAIAQALSQPTEEIMPSSVPIGSVAVKSPTGEIGHIPRSDVAEAIKEGYEVLPGQDIKSENYRRNLQTWKAEQENIRRRKVQEQFKKQAGKPRTSIYGIR